MRISSSLMILISVTTYLEGCRKSGDSSNKKCCADYYLKNGVCVACADGKYGPNCLHNCEFPKYGRRCLGGTCTCSRDACDPANGCRDTATSIQITSPKADPTSQISPTTTLTTKSVSISTTKQRNEGNGVELTTYVTWYSRNRSERFVTSHMKLEAEVIKDTQKSDDSQGISLNIIIVSIIGGLVILLLIIVIAVLVRGRRKVKVEKRESLVNNRSNANTYCEIDDLRLPSTSGNNRLSDVGKYELINQSQEARTRYSTLPSNCRSEHYRKSDVGKYELINQTEKERMKYSTLPPNSMSPANRNSYETPVPVAIQNTGTVEADLSTLDETKQVVSESSVVLRKASTNRNPNLLVVPNLLAASRNVSGYIDMDKGEKLDEYVPMKGQPKNTKISDSYKSEEKHLMNDTYR